MPRDPPHVCHAGVNVVGPQVERILRSHRREEDVARLRVRHALWLARAPGSVERKQHVLSLHGLAGAERPHLRQQDVHVDIAALGVRHVRVARAFEHKDVLHRGALRDGLVANRLQLQRFRAAHALVGDADPLGTRVDDAVAQGVGAEAGKDDAVRRADAAAREHRHGRLGHHGHVQSHKVALLHAGQLQSVGDAARAGEDVAVRQRLGVSRLVALPDDAGLVGQRGHVTVQAARRHVQSPTGEPRLIALVEAAVRYRRRRPHPIDKQVCLAQPKGIRDFLIRRDACVVHLLVMRHVPDRVVRPDGRKLLGQRRGHDCCNVRGVN
mmetsp:Transcript_4163/g.12979  ORF Transcript_4163/g.12979 Transcript_4163/m.12979 type:complete len:325 (-) Transcript_4163:2-976(-)